jgi:hypothetical protein
MDLRLLRWWGLVGVVAAGLGVSVHGQSSGIRENSYKPRTPFADVSGHPRDSSPLGTIDDSVNQSIELGAEGRFEGAQSRTAGLDQLQPSPRGGGQRSGLALSGGFSADAGARKFMPSQAFVKQSYSQAYVRPAYMAIPRMTAVPDSLRLAANGHGSAQNASPRGLQGAGTSGGASQNGVGSAATSGSMKALGRGGSNARRAGGVQGVQRGRSDTSTRAAGVRAFAGMDASGLEHGLEPERGSGNVEMPGSAQDAMQSPFERLGDPFRSASATGFEGFGTKSEFDRACGAACSLRSKGGADPFGGGSRDRRRSGEMPDSRFPDTEIPNAKVPDTKITFGQGLKLP